MTIQDMLDRMTWLGHDSFRIDGSKTVFFDPYNIQPDNKADLVLVTHEHFDHCSPASCPARSRRSSRVTP